jgi:hypothetical protein
MHIVVTTIHPKLPSRILQLIVDSVKWVLLAFAVLFSFVLLAAAGLSALLQRLFERKPQQNPLPSSNTGFSLPEWKPFLQLCDCRIDRQLGNEGIAGQPYSMQLRSTPGIDGLEQEIFALSHFLYHDGMFLIRINNSIASRTDGTLVFVDPLARKVHELCQTSASTISARPIDHDRVKVWLDDTNLTKAVIVHIRAT